MVVIKVTLLFSFFFLTLSYLPQPYDNRTPKLRPNIQLFTSLEVATTRRLPSDSGAFSDWVASSSSNSDHKPNTTHDLSLSFNTGPTASMSWPATSRAGYGIPSDMGMFVVAPGGGMIPHYYDSTYSTSDRNNNAATALGVGVIPLLSTVATADDGDVTGRNRTSSHLWQQQQQQMSVSGGGTATCQDCGNQSKKDCSHCRCRTCCKSRGFDCSTHVRSTWVPAARRRERHSIIASANNGGEGGGGSSGSSSGAKKPKIVSPQTTSNNSISNTPPPNFDTSSSHLQDSGFKEALPGQVRAPAMFKCVKVTAMENGNDELAYQAVVKIGGHLFKGFLYDQGVQPKDGIRNFSDLHLGGGGGRDGGFVSLQTPPLLDRNEVYGGGSGALIGVPGYGNTIN